MQSKFSYRKEDKSIDQLLNKCSKITRREYKRIHNLINRRFGRLNKCVVLKVADQYEYVLDDVMENNMNMILHDLSIKLCHTVEARPSITFERTLNVKDHKIRTLYFERVECFETPGCIIRHGEVVNVKDDDLSPDNPCISWNAQIPSKLRSWD